MASLRIAGVLVLVFCGLLAVPGCKKEAATAAPPPPTVTVAQPAVKEVADFDEYTGRFMAVEEVEVRAKVRGTSSTSGLRTAMKSRKIRCCFRLTRGRSRPR